MLVVVVGVVRAWHAWHAPHSSHTLVVSAPHFEQMASRLRAGGARKLWGLRIVSTMPALLHLHLPCLAGPGRLFLWQVDYQQAV